MTVEQILASPNTKAWKIRRLIDLGKTRVEIANLRVLGAYGAIQNVYAAYQRERSTTTNNQPNPTPVVNREPAAVTNPSVTTSQVEVPVMRANERPNDDRLKSMLGNRELKPLTEKFGIEIEAYDTNRNVLSASLNNVGVSCEVESYNHSTRRHWKITTDSSIRGEQAFEIVSPILVGQEGLDELKKVCTILQMSAARVNKSTGLHVHFDAANMSFQHIKNLMINYMNFEEEIDSFLSESRRGNVNSYTKSLKNIKLKIQAATNLEELKRANDNSRYFKVNLQSLNVHKTIEFRQHSGTVEYDKISNWIIFLHNLIDYSKQYVYPTSTANFEALKRLNQKVVYDFLVTRQNQLAA